MGEYLKKTYYVIKTPVIEDTNPNSVNSIYKYNVSSNGKLLYNDICMNAYIINGEKKNKVYYDDIVFYTPLNISNDHVNLYTGINSLISTYSYSTFNNIYELSNYISKRLLLLISKLQLANQCKRNDQKNKHQLAINRNRFNRRFNNKINIINDPKCNVFQPVSYNLNIPLFKRVNNDIEVIPGTTIKEKQIIQESNDINNLLTRFNEILTLIESNPNTVNYNELMNQQKQNEFLRNELDRKLAEIYEYRNTNIVKSQINLDNTIYTGVLWSILATSLAYFVFIKL